MSGGRHNDDASVVAATQGPDLPPACCPVTAPDLPFSPPALCLGPRLTQPTARTLHRAPCRCMPFPQACPPPGASQIFGWAWMYLHGTETWRRAAGLRGRSSGPRSPGSWQRLPRSRSWSLQAGPRRRHGSAECHAATHWHVPTLQERREGPCNAAVPHVPRTILVYITGALSFATLHQLALLKQLFTECLARNV